MARAEFRRPRTALAAGALAATIFGGLLLTGVVALDRSGPAPVAAEAASEPPPEAIPVLQPQAPAALDARLRDLVAAYGDPVGVAVADVEARWVAAVEDDGLYPQQSVSKLWVAVAVLEAVERGEIDLDHTKVLVADSDRSVFHQPIARQIGHVGYEVSVRELMRRALTESDNLANDKLIRTVGGVEAVNGALGRLRLSGVGIGAEEKDLQSQIAGLAWRPEYGYGRAFQEARAALPPAVRDIALDNYLAAPLDGSSPSAIVQTLAAIQRGEVLGPESTAVLLAMMHETVTGPNRLKGGLPLGWSIGHKTGTGQDWRGGSIGINNVGLLTAPDGRAYAVAVMMRRTFRAGRERMEFMQAVSQAVAEHWAAENPDAAALVGAPAETL